MLSALTFRPSEHLVRSLEFIDLHADAPVRKTTSEYIGLAGRVLVPIAFPRRGELIDNIRIESEGVQVRGYTLSRQLTIAAMRAVLLATARAVNLEDSDVPWEAIESVCLFIPAAATKDGMRLIDRLRDLLHSAFGSSLSADKVALIGALQFFARRQPLLLPCEVGQLIHKLTYERDITFLDMQHRGASEATRAALGRAPDYLRFDAPLATRAQSYHFRLRLPNGYFVRDIECRRKLRTGIRHDERQMWASYAPFHADGRVLAGTGPNPTELAHLQVINGGEIAEARLGIVVFARMAERPLGRMGAALIRLIVALLASILLPLYGNTVVVGNTASIGSVLLGLPALLGASLIATRSVRRVRDPLIARAGSAIAMGSAVASSIVLFVWTTAAASYKADHPALKVFPRYDATSGITLAFGLITAVAALMTIAVVASLTANSFRYLEALRRYRKSRAFPYMTDPPPTQPGERSPHGQEGEKEDGSASTQTPKAGPQPDDEAKEDYRPPNGGGRQ
jgi:hypothetical protein